MQPVRALTDFGDLALLVPLSALILVWLSLKQPRITALWWLIALALCVAATAAAKIYLYLCPTVPALHSPSGHTGLSTLVYGALTVIVAVESPRRWRAPIVSAGAILVIAIGLSRIALDAHTKLEVVAGLGIGALSLALFAQHYLRRRKSGVAIGWLLALAAVLAIVFHGQEVSAEAFLHSLGIELRGLGMACF